MQFWQEFEQGTQGQPPWTDGYPAQMPDGQYLTLPLREFGDVAVAGLIVNQASFHVLDRLTAWIAAGSEAIRGRRRRRVADARAHGVRRGGACTRTCPLGGAVHDAQTLV